jgi:hypothetical protein
MLLSSLPAKIATPFANAADVTHKRTIPVGSQIGITLGAASFTDGFPPACFSPPSSGGSWPFGQDFNGLLNQTTQWDRWQAAGGPVVYDAGFSASIGGYPLGARLLSSLGHAVWKSLVDNNTTNPDAGGAGWQIAWCAWTADIQTAGGSANLQTLTLRPAPTAMGQLANIPFYFRSVGNNTGAVTFNINALGAHPLTLPGGAALPPNALLTGWTYGAIWTGAIFELISCPSGLGFLSGSNLWAGSNTFAQGVIASGVNSNFHLRAANVTYGSGLYNDDTNTYLMSTLAGAPLGSFSGFRPFYWNMTTGAVEIDATGAGINTGGALAAGGALSGGSTVTANNGNVLANNGRLRATFGALASGDGNAAALLNDFPCSFTGSGWLQLPNGLVIQWGAVGAVAGAGPVAFSMSRTWPNGAPLAIMISYLSHNNPPTGSIGADFNGAANGQMVYQNTASAGTHGCYYIAIGF